MVSHINLIMQSSIFGIEEILIDKEKILHEDLEIVGNTQRIFKNPLIPNSKSIIHRNSTGRSRHKDSESGSYAIK